MPERLSFQRLGVVEFSIQLNGKKLKYVGIKIGYPLVYKHMGVSQMDGL